MNTIRAFFPQKSEKFFQLLKKGKGDLLLPNNSAPAFSQPQRLKGI